MTEDNCPRSVRLPNQLERSGGPDAAEATVDNSRISLRVASVTSYEATSYQRAPVCSAV
jgi:hypothetical protein